VAIEGAELGTEDAEQRQLERLDERDVHALLTRGGGDLAADPPAADHHEPAASVEGRADRGRVLDGAQEEHAVEVAAGHGKTARLAAGREQQTAVVEPLAARQDDGPPAPVDRLDDARGPELDVVGGVPAVVLLQPGGLLALAAPGGLAERPPLGWAARAA